MGATTRWRLLSLRSIVGFCVPVVVLVLCTVCVRTVAQRFSDHDAAVHLTAAVLGLLVMGAAFWRSREMTRVVFLAMFFSMFMLITIFDPAFWLIIVGGLVVGAVLGVIPVFLPEREIESGAGRGGGVA